MTTFFVQPTDPIRVDRWDVRQAILDMLENRDAPSPAHSIGVDRPNDVARDVSAWADAVMTELGVASKYAPVDTNAENLATAFVDAMDSENVPRPEDVIIDDPGASEDLDAVGTFVNACRDRTMIAMDAIVVAQLASQQETGASQI